MTAKTDDVVPRYDASGRPRWYMRPPADDPWSRALRQLRVDVLGESLTAFGRRVGYSEATIHRLETKGAWMPRHRAMIAGWIELYGQGRVQRPSTE